MSSNLKELLRTYSLPMSITPFLIAFFCAVKTSLNINASFFINSVLILTGIILVHLSSNLFDDYIDVKNALNAGLNLNDINFKNPKKAKLILNKVYSLKTVEKIIAAFLIFALVVGIYFIYLRGWAILAYIFTASFLCLFYPISSKYGMSEIITGVVFGPLLINASYFALTGTMNSVVFNFSIASGIVTSILLIAHSLMDYEYDVDSEKKTIPVLLKNKYLTVNFISILIIAAYCILLYSICKYEISRLFSAPVILTLPVSIKLISSLYDYIEIKDVKFIPKWYFGTMENWDEIVKSGFAYFMYRFYLARNLAVIFNIVLALSCLIAFFPIRNFEHFEINFTNRILY